MRKNYIKFPTAFFDTKEWQKPRKYSKAEALLYLISQQGDISIRHLASAWQWSKTSVERFIEELKKQKLWDTFWNTFRDTNRTHNKRVAEDCGTQSGTPFGTHLIKDNYTPPSILSISKDISNIHIPPKGETHSLFSNFQKWILDNAPRVARMKEPFTEAQYLALKDEFDTTFICDLLREMHNYEPLLTKNRSANLTFRNWARRRNKWDNNEKSKRTTNTAGNAEPDEILRAVAEGIARSRTHQEWQS